MMYSMHMFDFVSKDHVVTQKIKGFIYNSSYKIKSIKESKFGNAFI